MSRVRRLTLALALLASCNAELRCDPSFSCSSRPPATPDILDCQRDTCVVTHLAAGAQHTCITVESAAGVGRTRCWGRDDAQQLTGGNPSALPGGALVGNANAISAGVLHTCAIGSSTLACWGTNTAGLLSSADVDATWLVRRPIVEAGEPHVVSAGSAHTCTLDDDRVVRCFGDNTYGQLGEFDAPYLAVWGSWITLPPIDAMDAGGVSTCAWSRETEEVLCWGRELPGDPPPEGGARILHGVRAVDGLSVGATHACMVQEGRVRCWGDDTDGQLGDGEPSGRVRTPVDVELPAPARAVSAGGFIPVAPVSRTSLAYAAPSRSHTCALLETGEVHCWGANHRGQLGDGTTIDRTRPVRVALDGPARALSAGGEHTCAITDAGLRCWGDNTRGQIAADAEPLVLLPRPIALR